MHYQHLILEKLIRNGPVLSIKVLLSKLPKSFMQMTNRVNDSYSIINNDLQGDWDNIKFEFNEVEHGIEYSVVLTDNNKNTIEQIRFVSNPDDRHQYNLINSFYRDFVQSSYKLFKQENVSCDQLKQVIRPLKQLQNYIVHDKA